MLTSEALSKRAAAVTPGGVHSNVRLTGPRAFIARGAGARIWDVDGTEYIDYLLGQGPNFLGHAPADVVDAVSMACRDGIVFGGQHPIEVEAAEAVISALGWPDMVRFTSTGTEAVQATMRLARAHTGRRLIVRFEGHYHGWLDNVLLASDGNGWGPASPGQLSGDLSESIVLGWNDPQAVDAAFERHGSEIAAILTEPAMLNSGAIPPQAGYLEYLRAVADAHGSLLIFDEVITGFRLALGGGAERFGVAPDLAAYGKAMAAGYPVAAFAGRADVWPRCHASPTSSGAT
jgi:glutamate-1-semialdehyde 2,1-aminomutase